MRTILTSLMWIAFTGTLLAISPASQYETAAKKLTNVLLERDDHSVSLGTFHGDQDIQRGIPGYQLAFAEAFEAENEFRKSKNEPHVSLTQQSKMRIDGVVTIEDDPNDLGSPEHKRFLVVKTTLTIFDGSDEVYPFTFYLDRSRDIVQAAGIGISIKDQDSRGIHRQIRLVRKNIVEKKSTFVLDPPSKIKNLSSSPYAVEILTKSPVGKTYSPRGPANSNAALPFVPLGVGELYALKFYNDSDQEVAVGMQIDGIDQFQFSEDRDDKTGRPKFSHWIVGPRKTFTIKGWHLTAKKSEENLASFLVTKYGEGAAQHVNRPGDAQDGVITVSVSHAHDPSSGTSKSSAQTGFGPPIAQDQTVVRRKIDPPHEFFAVQYAR